MNSIKGMMFIILIALIIIILLWSYIHSKKKETKINDDTKDDNYWENRFKGLKIDYEDREKYHIQKYDQLKLEYESRERFLKSMLEDTRKDYQAVKINNEELTKNNALISDELLEIKKKIIELEVKQQTL